MTSRQASSGKNGASRRSSQFAFNVPLNSLPDHQIEVTALRQFDDSLSVGFINFTDEENNKIVKSWAGGDAVVLAVEYNAKPQRGPARTDVLLKVEESEQEEFCRSCRLINQVAECIGQDKQLIGSQVILPFSESTQNGEGVLFRTRFYEPQPGARAQYNLRSETGKKTTWFNLAPGTKIHITDLAMNNVRLNVDDESGKAYTRISVMPKNIRVVDNPRTLSHDGSAGVKKGGKRKAGLKMSVKDLLASAKKTRAE